MEDVKKHQSQEYFKNNNGSHYKIYFWGFPSHSYQQRALFFNLEKTGSSKPTRKFIVYIQRPKNCACLLHLPEVYKQTQ